MNKPFSPPQRIKPLTFLQSPKNSLTVMKSGCYQTSPNPPFFDNPLWDIRKASQMLSVSEKTLRDWVYKKQIPFKKVGNLVRFDPSEIHDWIEERNRHGH